MRAFPQTRNQLVRLPFLAGPDWGLFANHLDICLAETEPGDSVLCGEVDRVRALAVVFATLIRGGGVFLSNPAWRESEWRQVNSLTHFHQVRGHCPLLPNRASPRFEGARVMIPSGGTSGVLRFCVHSVDTLAAAVRSLHEFHGGIPLHSINPLPVFHVSGLMPVLRACLTKGQTLLCDWKRMERGDLPTPPANPCSISLVPTQLARLVAGEVGLRFLHGLEYIYVGGAAVSPGLIRLVRSEKLPVYFVYGMTETAAMVVVGSRADTDSSGNCWGRPLPGVSISLTARQGVSIRANSLFRGYFPEDGRKTAYVTRDLGKWLPDGQLQVLGRGDFVINTGGEKVNPEEVEAALSDLLPGIPLAVTSRPSRQFGEEVVALVFEEGLTAGQAGRIQKKLGEVLAPHKNPKEFIPVKTLPLSSSGKPIRARLRDYL